MAKKASISQQGAPVETVSGAEYSLLYAETDGELVDAVNEVAADGWRLHTVVDRPGQHMLAWLERGR